jgi:hypothetical protein
MCGWELKTTIINCITIFEAGFLSIEFRDFKNGFQDFMQEEKEVEDTKERTDRSFRNFQHKSGNLFLQKTILIDLD